MDNPVTWWVLAAILFIIAVVGIFFQPINHDVAWYLYGSGRLLEGARLYHDIVDVNPPLVFYWGIPAVWIAHLLQLPEVIVFKIYVLLVVVLSWLMCRQILNQISESIPLVVHQCLLLMLIFLVLRPHFFAQREHIMLVLVVPYVLAAVGWAVGRPLNGRFLFLIGGLAGVGLALKPVFLFLWLVMESYLAFVTQARFSLRRPENIGIAAVLVAYGTFVIFRVPEYYEEILPLARQVYGGYNCDLSYLFLHPCAALWVVALIAFLVVRPAAHSTEIRRILLIVSGSLLVIAFVQRKGFYYHFYPTAVTAVLLLAVIVFDSMETVKAVREFIIPGKHVLIVVIIMGLFAISGYKAVVLSRRTQDPLLSSLILLAQEHAQGEAIVLFSSSVFPAFPLVNYSGVLWSSRFNCLWPLPGLYSNLSSQSEKGFPYHTRDEMDVTEQFLVDTVVSDLLRTPPVLVIADCSPIKQGFGKTTFEYIEYFLRDHRFVEFWTNYSFLTSVDNYRVFKRKKDPAYNARNAQQLLESDLFYLARI